MRKIILYGLGLIMLGLFLSPPASAVAVKLGKASSDNIDYNMKGMPSRTTPITKLECVRSKDCGVDGTKFCSNNKCVPCTYSCPRGRFIASTGKCDSTAISVTGVKSNPICGDKNITCYTAGSNCISGQVCAGNTCIACTHSCPSGYSASSTGKCGSVVTSVAGNKSNPACPNQNLSCYTAGTDCASGSVCSSNTCIGCTYSCPAWGSHPNTSSTGKCGSTATSVAGNKSNWACPDQSKTCYSTGVSCPLGQSCSNNVCKNLDTCEKTKATCVATIGGSEADWTVSGTGATCACTTSKRYVMTNDCTTFNEARVCRIKAVKDFVIEKIIYKTVTTSVTEARHLDDGSVHETRHYDNTNFDFPHNNNPKSPCPQCARICTKGNMSILKEGYYYCASTGYSYACEQYCKCMLDQFETFTDDIWFDTIEVEDYRTTLLSVKVGDIGGYIEKEANLSQSYGGWVGVNAKVYGSGSVYNAYVYGNAVVSGGSASSGQIYDDAVMTGGSLSGGSIFGNARNHGCMIMDNAKLYGSAVIGTSKSSSYSCELHENVEVYGNAIINDDVRLWGNVKVYDNARIGTASQIYIKGTTYIYGSARVYGHKNWYPGLDGRNLYIGGSVKFCNDLKTWGTFTSGTVTGDYETSCNPPF